MALQAGAGAGAGAGLLGAAGWAVLGAGSLVAAAYTLLLSLTLDRAGAASWLRSAGLSLLQSALVQPVKVPPGPVRPPSTPRPEQPGPVRPPGPVPQIAALRLLHSELRPRWLWHEAAGDPQLRRALALLGESRGTGVRGRGHRGPGPR